MDLTRLAAVACAVALHAAVIAGVLGFAGAPSPQSVRPIQVALIEAPPPPRIEPSRIEPRIETPRAEPPSAPPTAPAREPPHERPAPPAEMRPDEHAAPATHAEREQPRRRRPLRETAAPAPPRPETADEAKPRTARDAAPAPAKAAPSAEQPSATPTVPTTPVFSAPAAPSAPSTASAAPPASAATTAPRVDASWRGNTPPPYPGAARRMGDEGEVRLDVHVGADGTVLDVRLRQSSGSPVLDRTAIETVRRWRFEPATDDGRAVAAWYHDWRWVFRLEG